MGSDEKKPKSWLYIPGSNAVGIKIWTLFHPSNYYQNLLFCFVSLEERQVFINLINSTFYVTGYIKCKYNLDMTKKNYKIFLLREKLKFNQEKK